MVLDDLHNILSIVHRLDDRLKEALNPSPVEGLTFQQVRKCLCRPHAVLRWQTFHRQIEFFGIGSISAAMSRWYPRSLRVDLLGMIKP